MIPAASLLCISDGTTPDFECNDCSFQFTLNEGYQAGEGKECICPKCGSPDLYLLPEGDEEVSLYEVLL